MIAPIIFIHYSDSYYLKHTLKSALLFNPGKRVILLGDSTNLHYQKIGIEHFNYEDFSTGFEIDLFDKVYKFTAGKLCDNREWTRFVFRRWFNIYNFIKSNRINSFWTFDSDNLILTDLSVYEARFLNYDCTEQCSGICMNGFISNLNVVKGYIDKINELFQRTSFLKQQRESLKHFPRYAFTEMRAYIAYREESQIKRIRLNQIINGETFLDSICTVDEHKWLFMEDDFETYEEKLHGKDLKKIYLSSDGNLFVRHRSSGELVRLNTINMSWVPEWLFNRLLNHSKRKLKPNILHWFFKPKIKVMDLFPYLSAVSPVPIWR